MLNANFSGAIAWLDAMLARLQNPEPALAIIGQRQRDAIRQRIQRTKVDPDGALWAPWMPSTREQREAKGNAGQGLLWDEGTLLESIHSHASAHGVEIASDASFAHYLQDGTRKMEARPFMGWNDDDM